MTTSARRLLLLFLVLFMAAPACSGGNAAEPPATTRASSAAPLVPGAYQVATEQLPLVDRSRDTDPTPGSPGDERQGRALPTTVWYPTGAAGPFPLIVFGHGLGAAPDHYSALLSSWAAAGFVVAAPAFPLTSAGSDQVIDDIPNQPADVSFVLTQVLALAATPGDVLDGLVDPGRITMAGHSAGAMTTIGLLSGCCADSRITSAVVLAGSPMFFGTDFERPGVPMLFEHGTDDQSIPPTDGEKVYRAAPADKAAVLLLGAGHSAPYDDPTDPAFPAVVATTTDFLRWVTTGDDADLAELRADADRTQVAQLAADDLPG
jgi:fermentation-respiration switch protein FrsA (DUF1100 family)